ncbi:thermonuclease family protein [Desulfonatronospira sp.]|uniref:thermonuclease family protein n=1 Tax=Desulfonatronospira sp. TaxID=1962951 RepID=UPI0025C63418|nr:thermonuclease family protein [Desulfonatronospira sp.]
MRTRWWTCIFWLFFLILFFGPALAWGQARDVRVAWVPDGDTLILEGREVVRIKGIDAPETAGNGHPDQYFAREATDRLEELVQGRVITLKPGQVPEDRYGRTLAHAYLPSGENIGLLLVREGLAFYYPHEDQDERISRDLLRAQQRAIKQEAGFWAVVLKQYPEVESWAGNKRSKRFHHPDCGYGQRMSGHNREEFETLREIFYAGYAPCRRCTPWPDADR